MFSYRGGWPQLTSDEHITFTFQEEKKTKQKLQGWVKPTADTILIFLKRAPLWLQDVAFKSCTNQYFNITNWSSDV